MYIVSEEARRGAQGTGKQWVYMYKDTISYSRSIVGDFFFHTSIYVKRMRTQQKSFRKTDFCIISEFQQVGLAVVRFKCYIKNHIKSNTLKKKVIIPLK